jgi:hypothetical protein
MQRRDFLKTSLAAGSVAAMSPLAAAAEAKSTSAVAPAREFYELRRYQLRRGPMQTRFDEFARDVALPAWNRAGVGPIGVFDVMFGPGAPAKYVLLPYRSLAAFLEARERTAADPAIQQAPFTNVPATDPAYLGVESSLFHAFRTMPKLELPKETKGNQPRVFELRIYQSHSRQAARKKIEMFDTGEIALFRKTGLTPVFFGESLIGGQQPNLTYLLVFPDMAAREKNWDTFRNHPEWKVMSSRPGFTDPEIVTNITNLFLRPTAYSQI